MKFTPTELDGAFIIDLELREDARGWFARTYCAREFEAHGLPTHMVQTNMSLTRKKGTLRGMHYQHAPHGEDKLVRCVGGAIWDCIVDLRPQSPTYCRWIGVELSEAGATQGLFDPAPAGLHNGAISKTVKLRFADFTDGLSNTLHLTESATYCQWIGVELTEANGRSLLVPKGFAHGFVTLSDDAAVTYQVSEFYTPASEAGARWDDPAFGIAWPVPVLDMSDKDRNWPAHVKEAQ